MRPFDYLRGPRIMSSASAAMNWMGTRLLADHVLLARLTGWKGVKILGPMMTAAEAARWEQGKPLWFMQATRQLREWQHGEAQEEVLGVVHLLVRARAHNAYAHFAEPILQDLALEAGTSEPTQAPQVLSAHVQAWALYVERHMLHEFLEDSGGDPGSIAEPVLQLQLAAGTTSSSSGDQGADVESHMDEWIGTAVQYYHDCHVEGFATTELQGVLRDEIKARGEYSFTCLSETYLRGIASQVATFPGPSGALPPPSAGEWTQGMATALWLMYREEGLCAHGTWEPAPSSDGSSVTGDEMSLVQRDQPKRKWLAEGPSRRRRAPQSRRDRGAPLPKSMPRRDPGRCSTERVDLSAVARSRAARTNAVPAMVPGGPDVRDAPASSSDGVRTGERRPLTIETAVDTWLLVLGVKDIDEEDEASFLPGRVVGSIQETFLGYNGQDRLTMTLAFTRVVQGLLSAVGRVLEDAAARPAVSTVAGSGTGHATVTGGGGPELEEEIEVEPEPDENSYMQMPGGGQWYAQLQKLQAQLEDQPKATRMRNVKYLVSWLDHRSTNTREGFWLGHCEGAASDLLALLAAYMDDKVEVVRGGELQEGWSRDWGLSLAGFLPVQPGSRLAMGLPPLQEPPIMNFLVPIPDARLHDRDLPDNPDEADTLPLPGQLEDAQVSVDELLEIEEEERQWRKMQEDRWAHEEQLEDERVTRDTTYLRSLAPSDRGCKRGREVLVVEVSSGSSDRPRVARCVRVPVEQGVASLSLRIWRDDEESQGDIETVPFEAAGVGNMQETHDPAVAPFVTAEVERDLPADSMGVEGGAVGPCFRRVCLDICAMG